MPIIKKLNAVLGRFPADLRRFLIVGGVSTILNYSVFAVLFRIAGVYYVWASVAGYISVLFLGYFLNRAWSFSSVIQNKKKEFVIYASVCIASLFLSVGALKIAVQGFGINPFLGNIVAIGVSTVSNFLGLKFIAFNSAAVSFLSRTKQYLWGRGK